MMMSWQDWVIGVGQFLFALALVPAIRASEKPPLSTCALTAALLMAFCAAYASLGLWLAASSVALFSGMWTALARQSYLRFRARGSSTITASYPLFKSGDMLLVGG